jgi:hypothetical protein
MPRDGQQEAERLLPKEASETSMSYQGVMRLARDREVVVDYGWKKVDWLQIVRLCYQEAMKAGGHSFPGSTIAFRAGWFPGLNKLRRYGIVVRDDRLSNRRETWWQMPDPAGVAKALGELGYL